jgi:hypothetical protein
VGAEQAPQLGRASEEASRKVCGAPVVSARAQRPLLVPREQPCCALALQSLHELFNRPADRHGIDEPGYALIYSLDLVLDHTRSLQAYTLSFSAKRGRPGDSVADRASPGSRRATQHRRSHAGAEYCCRTS